jgi:hypothetical protein
MAFLECHTGNILMKLRPLCESPSNNVEDREGVS